MDGVTEEDAMAWMDTEGTDKWCALCTIPLMEMRGDMGVVTRFYEFANRMVVIGYPPSLAVSYANLVWKKLVSGVRSAEKKAILGRHFLMHPRPISRYASRISGLRNRVRQMSEQLAVGRANGDDEAEKATHPKIFAKWVAAINSELRWCIDYRRSIMNTTFDRPMHSMIADFPIKITERAYCMLCHGGSFDMNGNPADNSEAYNKVYEAYRSIVSGCPVFPQSIGPYLRTAVSECDQLYIPGHRRGVDEFDFHVEKHFQHDYHPDAVVADVESLIVRSTIWGSVTAREEDGDIRNTTDPAAATRLDIHYNRKRFPEGPLYDNYGPRFRIKRRS